MKKIVYLLVLMASTSAFACPEVTGKYLCPEEAAHELALGGRQVEIGGGTYGVYTVTLGNSAAVYEVGSRNPLIDPNTGEIDFSVTTLAECRQEALLLHHEVTESDEDITVTVSGTHEVKPMASGIRLRYLLEGDELYSFQCDKL